MSFRIVSGSSSVSMTASVWGTSSFIRLWLGFSNSSSASGSQGRASVHSFLFEGLPAMTALIVARFESPVSVAPKTSL